MVLYQGIYRICKVNSKSEIYIGVLEMQNNVILCSLKRTGDNYKIIEDRIVSTNRDIENLNPSDFLSLGLARFSDVDFDRIEHLGERFRLREIYEKIDEN